MNCIACRCSIDQSSGYYLVNGIPYCVDCYQPDGSGLDAHGHRPHREPENLLEAFRAYQKRSAGGQFAGSFRGSLSNPVEKESARPGNRR